MDDEFSDHVIGNQILYDKDGNAVLVSEDGGRAIVVRDIEQLDVLRDIKKQLSVISFYLSQIVDYEMSEEDLED